MDITSRDAFKYAFVKSCRDQGLSDDQITEKAVKLASNGFSDTINNVVNSFRNHETVSRMLENNKTMAGLALGAVTAVPLVAGAGLGAGLSYLKGDYSDADDVKNQELLNEYKRQSELMKQHQRIKNLGNGI